MPVKSEDLVAQAREAREAAGISQRTLRDRTGLTQSHISQIESGRVDPSLSVFIDIARALDLELALIPKKMVPAIRGLIRAQSSPAGIYPSDSASEKLHVRAERVIRKLKRLYGSSADLDRIEEYLRFIRHVSFSETEAEQVKGLISKLERHQASPQASPIIHNIARELQSFRNSIAHGANTAPRPAYALNAEEEDE